MAGKPWGTHEEERLALLARLGPIAAPSDAARDVLRAIMGATPPAPPAESGGPSDAEATRRRQPLIASAWERLASITDAEVARVVARVADGHAALTDDERDDVEIVALTRAKDLERSLAAAAETARAPLGQARACEALCRVADLPFFTESCATPGGRARILAFWREVEGLPRRERYRRCVAEAYAKNDPNTGEPGSQDLAAWLTQHTAFAVEAAPIGPRVAAWRDWRSEWLRRKADDPTSWLLVGIVHAHPGALPSRTELLTRFEASERDERPWLHFLLWLTTPEGEEAPGRGLRWSSWTASRGRAEPLHLDVAWHRRILGADAPPTHQVRVAALSFASDARTVDVLWEQVKPLRFGDHARIHRVTRLEPLASAGPSLGAPPRLPGRAETVGVAPGAGPGALDLDVGVTPAFSGGRMGLAFTQAEARAIGGAHVGFALPYGGRVRAGHVAPLGGALGARSVLVVATLEPIDPAAGPYLVSRWSEALSAQLEDLVRDAEAVRVSARTWRGTGLADEAQADLEESTRCAAIVAALLPDPRWSEAVEQLARSVSLGEDRTRTGDPALQALHLARLAHLASSGEAIELQPGAYFTPFQRALGGALRTEDGSQAGSAPELYALRLALAARSAIVRRQALDALRPLLTDVRGSWARPIVRAHFARSGDALPLWLPVGAGGGSSSPHRPLLALAATATMALALGWSRPRVRRGAAGCLVGAGVALLATCDGSADAHRVGSLAVLAGLSVLFASLPGTRLRWLAVPSAVGFFGATIAAWVPAAEMRRVEVLDAMLRLACAAVPCVAIAMHAAARRPSPSGRAAVDLRRARPRLSIAEIPWLLLAGLFAFVYAVGGHEGWDRGRAVGLAVALAFVLGSATRRWQTDREEEPGRFHRGLARASAWTGAHRKLAAGCAAGLLLLVALLSTWPPSGLPNPTKAPEVRIGEARSLETAGRDEEAVAAYENALGAVGWTLEAVERGSILEPSSSEREAVAGLVRTRASWATALADAGDLEGARRTARVAVLAATRLGFDRGAADPATRDGIDRARFVMALARARGGTGGDVLDALELPRARDPDVDDDTLTAWRDRWPHVAPLLRVPLLDTAAPLHADASALFLRLVVEEPNLDRPDARLARWLAGERDAGLPVLRELVAAPLAEGEDARSWWRAIERVAGAVGVTCGERAVDVCAEVARDAKAPEGTRARAAELLCRLGDLPLTFVPAETRREAGVPQVPVEDFARRADALALWAEVRSLSRLAGFRRRLERAFADASDDSIGFQWIQCHTGDFGTTGPLWRAWWGRNRARDPRAWLGPETLPAEKDLASLPAAELLAKVFPAGGEPPTSPARRARAHQLLLLAAPQEARVPVSATPFGLLDDTFLDEPDDLCRAWHEALGADGRMPTFRLVVAETVRETPFAPLAIGWYSEWTLHAGGTLAVELPADPAAKPPIEPVPPARAGDIGPPPAWWRECVLPGLLHVSDAWFRRPNDVRRADPDRTWRPEVGVDVRTLGASVGWTPATGWCLRSHGFGDAGDPRRGARNRLRPDRCGAIRVRGPFLQTLLLPEQPLVPGDLASWRGVVARALGQATSDVRTIGGHEDPRDRPGAILGLMPLLAAATVRGDELAGGAARLDLEIQRQASAGRMPDLDRARLLAALAFGTATSDAMRDAEAKLDAVTWIRAAGATASANARAAAWKRALSAGLDVPTAIAIDAARRAGQVEVPADLQAQVEFARTGPHRMLFGMHSEEPRSPPWDVAAVLLVGAFALGVAWRRRRRAVDPTRPAAIALLLGLAAAASRVRLGTSILPNLELGLAISAGAAALGGRSGGVVPRIAPATLGIGVALLLASRLLPPFDGLDVAGTAMVALGVSTLAWLRVPRAGTQGLSRPERAEGATRAFLLALGLAMTFGYLLVARPGTFPDGEGRAAAPGMPAWLVVGAGISLLTLWATAGNRAPPSRARRRHPPPKPPPRPDAALP